jgi:uncharacterized protein YhdP
MDDDQQRRRLRGDVWLKKGGASWLGENRTHTLSVDNLTAHISREEAGWQFSIPDTRITWMINPGRAVH